VFQPAGPRHPRPETKRPWPALWRLELSTGLRRAEPAGLRWSDVDLDGGALSVRVQRTTEGYAVVERELKTGAGRRLVPLDADVVASLRAWRKRQVEERLAYGPAYEDTGLAFTREDGAGYHPQRLSVTFRARREADEQPSAARDRQGRRVRLAPDDLLPLGC